MRLLCRLITLSSLCACSAGTASGELASLPNQLSTIRHSSSGYQYETLVSFEGYNGAKPDGVLVYYRGKLYGTTEAGGAYTGGTVFSVTPSGDETVLHNFGESADGADPKGGLTFVNGTFYGTTYSGGSHDHGSVFSITPAGDERVIYSFGDHGGDGANPDAGLTSVDGVLFGTTYSGGSSNAGTVFKVSLAGSEKIVFYFPNYAKKTGEGPMAGLFLYSGKLYGTTDYSGRCSKGTVYDITTAGSQHTIHDFGCQRNDGQSPQAPVVAVNGVLYGTTTWGGQFGYNDGAVYSIGSSGQEKVIFDFVPSSEYGSGANTALVTLGGVLYGTTPSSGANGGGVLYGVTTSGTATVLHSFGTVPDGTTPLAGLTDVGGVLYGTTSSGGSILNDGAIYRIAPSSRL
jgi:uncharacterized repeat protein (TIGR03803 family)